MSPNWFFGIEPNAFGAVGAVVNFIVAYTVANFTTKVPQKVEDMITNIRTPN
jgi:cation/acetate symporter